MSHDVSSQTITSVVHKSNGTHLYCKINSNMGYVGRITCHLKPFHVSSTKVMGQFYTVWYLQTWVMSYDVSSETFLYLVHVSSKWWNTFVQSHTSKYSYIAWRAISNHSIPRPCFTLVMGHFLLCTTSNYGLFRMTCHLITFFISSMFHKSNGKLPCNTSKYWLCRMTCHFTTFSILSILDQSNGTLFILCTTSKYGLFRITCHLITFSISSIFHQSNGTLLCCVTPPNIGYVLWRAISQHSLFCPCFTKVMGHFCTVYHLHYGLFRMTCHLITFSISSMFH